MSDYIGHECGLALVRPKMSLEELQERNGDAAWALRRLHLLMEKQHNRGQDGAGIAVVKFDMPPGEPYLRRHRSTRHNAIERIFDSVTKDIAPMYRANRPMSVQDAKRKCNLLGDVYIGHLRYGTHSKNSVQNCHPLVRKDNTASRNLAMAGNFNMTNSRALFEQLLDYGLNPVGDSDTQVILERIGYFLDLEHRHLRSTMGPESFLRLEGRELAEAISRDIDLVRVLGRASEQWDGGYAFAGLLGNGDAFVCRDPAGIRPLFWYEDDDVIAAASERPALMSTFDAEVEDIRSIEPGHVLVMKRDGTTTSAPFTERIEQRQCTFERIYFSRGSDPDIYAERKQLGRNLAAPILEAIDHDVEHAVISYVPNTAESAFFGLVEEVERQVKDHRAEAIWNSLQDGVPDLETFKKACTVRIRAEKVAHKDQRLRTFITHDAARRDLVTHIYDITRQIVTPEDTLVVLDDSIVRGTTLRESIITILSRLNPKRILIASSAPPIMYPDCYGIDMSHLGRFIGFQAAVALLEDHGQADVLEAVEHDCRAQLDLPPEELVNHVQRIYEPFSLDQIGAKVAELVRPDNVPWDGALDVVYQGIEGLQSAMPAHTGDWYFTGRYPTPGGYKVLNRAYLNWREGRDQRSY
ncbi:MAG: amidophosphoribosyltransferase [Phycisphaerae bacterium]|nr:amidophosphoribosyltransferase [Phycisphaerae bacterium]MDG1898704.1 hypothetical protein [Phycisphaerales bacterium]|tara:strand:+ start:54 stop:1967 length:1914 start_codon:yes stop_codon:yes gene_type:complete